MPETDGQLTSRDICNQAVIERVLADASVSSLKIAANIQSDNFVAGTSGWKIERNTGSAEFQDVIIRGTLNADDITVGTLDADRIAADTITVDKLATGETGAITITIGAGGVIQSTDASPDVVINGDGSATFKNLTVTGNSSVDGDLVASGITASNITTGTLNASVVNVTNLDADEINVGILSAVDIQSNNWNGGSSVPSTGASAGFMFDSSNGSGQFEGDLFIEGDLFTTSDPSGGGRHVRIRPATANERISWFNNNTEESFIENVAGAAFLIDGHINQLSLNGTTIVIAPDAAGDVHISRNSGSGDFPQLKGQGGTAALPGYTFEEPSVDYDTGMFRLAANVVALVGGGSHGIRVDGTNLAAIATTTGGFLIKNNGAGSGGTPTYSFRGDTNTGMYRFASDEIAFATGGGTRVRMDTAYTGSGGVGFSASNSTARWVLSHAGQIQTVQAATIAATFGRNNDGGVVDLRRSGTQVGTISVTATNTAYNTSSDERLKANIRPFVNGLDLVRLLPVREWEWKKTGEHAIGLVAQEVASILPDITTAPETIDGEETGWLIDYGRLSPWNTRAIQELADQLDDALARITELELAA